MLTLLQHLLQNGLILSLLLQQLLQEPGVEQGRAFTFYLRQVWLISVSSGVYLPVSSFILLSSTLTERWAWCDSCETVELSVLTPDVATVSSWAAAGGTRLWWAASPVSGSTSSTSSWSAGSLSEARLK